jgi:hypothetical protein
MKKDRDYKPVPRVKMTLNLAWQNKLLLLLAEHFGVHESYTEDHVLIVHPGPFMKFFVAASKRHPALTLRQLKVEHIDARKEPRITVVRNWGTDCPSSYVTGNEDGEPFAKLVDGHVTPVDQMPGGEPGDPIDGPAVVALERGTGLRSYIARELKREGTLLNVPLPAIERAVYVALDRVARQMKGH